MYKPIIKIFIFISYLNFQFEIQNLNKIIIIMYMYIYMCNLIYNYNLFILLSRVQNSFATLSLSRRAMPHQSFYTPSY